MNVNFKGFMEEVTTFECDSTVTAGVPVKLLSSGKVSACADGNNFIGVAVNVRDGYCAVQLHGYVEMPVSGTVAVGHQKLSAAASGKIKANTSTGREYLVLDTSADNIGFIL